jgi:hypothetical protein
MNSVKSIMIEILASLFFLFSFALAVLWGCAGRTVRIELPANHPANPQAAETVLKIPFNPFQTELAILESTEQPEDSAIMHQRHKKGEKQPMDHTMDHKEGRQHESPSNVKPADNESKHQPWRA